MAITSRNKRASILGIGLAASIVYPNPSGTIDQAARQQTAYAYPGILASSPYQLDPSARRVLSMARTQRILEIEQA